MPSSRVTFSFSEEKLTKLLASCQPKLNSWLMYPYFLCPKKINQTAWRDFQHTLRPTLCPLLECFPWEWYIADHCSVHVMFHSPHHCQLRFHPFSHPVLACFLAMGAQRLFSSYNMDSLDHQVSSIKTVALRWKQSLGLRLVFCREASYMLGIWEQGDFFPVNIDTYLKSQPQFLRKGLFVGNINLPLYLFSTKTTATL